jgi:LacI family transcriptional regulator
MRDVAALAGVSLKTVSRVVNRESGVSPEMAGRVAAAVARLDYRHNLAASNLRRGRRTRSIGVLLQDVANSFSASILRAVEDRCTSLGVVVLAASIDEEPERERALVSNLVSRRVDGLVLMPSTTDQGYLLQDVRAGLAVVVVDRPVRGLDVDSVTVDNEGGIRLAVEHLLAHGHRRIGYVGDLPSIATAAARLDGYARGLGAGGVPVDGTLMRVGRDEAASAAAVAGLLALPDPPTAVVAGRNVLAVGAVRALQEAGLSHRVALVGFDDFPMSDLLEPGLTVIRQDVNTIGRTAAELLLSRVEGVDPEALGQPRRVVLPTALVPRGSGEIPAARR